MNTGAAGVNACNKLLDRGYGKPSTDAGGFAQASMFPVGVNVDVRLATEIRDEARRFANLAVATLCVISERGAVESARVPAAGLAARSRRRHGGHTARGPMATKRAAESAKIDPFIAAGAAAILMSWNPVAKKPPKYQLMIV